MQYTSTQAFDGGSGLVESIDRQLSSDEWSRLEQLIALNIHSAAQRQRFPTEDSRLRFELMRNQLTAEKAFALFGLFIGISAPFSIILRFILDAHIEAWLVALCLAANSVTAAAGYFTGRITGKMVRISQEYDWITMTIFLTALGAVWGLFCGFAGGLVILIFGAIVGGAFGLATGAVALPLFSIFHRLLKYKDEIELRHFLPLSIGTALTISAFILGYAH